MNVTATKVNTQSQTNLEKTAKVATKAAAIGGGMQAIGGAALSIAAAKGKTGDIYTAAVDMLAPNSLSTLDGDTIGDIVKGYKEFFSDLLEDAPKTVKKLLKPITNDKNLKEASEQLLDLANTEATGKINWKSIGKRSLKIAGKWGAVIGAAYLAGKTITDHIQAKKAE